MCATCGCSPDHHHQSGEKKVLDVEQDILHENNLLAQRNRGYFEGKNIDDIGWNHRNFILEGN